MRSQKGCIHLAFGDCLVWVSERGHVYVGDPSLEIDIPSHQIAGVFSLGQSFEAIADDLTALRESLSLNWILDDEDQVSLPGRTRRA
jgi:hypothetical protein